MKMIQDAVSLWSEEDGGNGCAAPAAGGGVVHASIPAENNNNVKEYQDDSLDSGSAGDIRKIKLDSTDPDPDHDLQPPTSEQMNICLGNIQSTSSPLGLKLRTSTSFLTLLQSKISQNPSQVEPIDIHSQPIAEKIKASNFPAKILKIGSWERVSKHEGDVVAKCYYAKKKLVWEFLEKSLKRKIEIQWADILSIRAVIQVKRPGILEIELNQPPTFHHEIDPQPRKHTNWKLCADFTDGQAPICRRHYMEFAPGVLDRHYDKLLQYDSRLCELSKQPFPSLRNPYFQSITYGNASDFPLDNYCNGSQVPSHLSFNPGIFSFLNSQTSHRGPSVPTPHHPHHHHQQIPLSSLAAVDSTSPHSDDFMIRGEKSGHQGMAVWGQDSSYQAGYSAGNQGTQIWGQGSSNSYDYSAGYQVPGQMMIDHPSPTPSSVHYQNNNFWLDASAWLDDDRTVSDELEQKLWFGAEIGHGNMTDNRLWNVPQIRQPNITYSSVELPQLSNGNEMTEQASYRQVTGNGTGMGLAQPLDGNAMADQSNYGQVAGNDTDMGLPQLLDGNALTDQANYGQVAGNGTGMGLPQQLDGNAMTGQVNYGQVASNGTGMGLFTNPRPQEFSYLPPARVACETLPVKLPQFSGHTNEQQQGFSCSTHTQVPGEILPMQQSSDYLMHDMMHDLDFFNNINGTINWNL